MRMLVKGSLFARDGEGLFVVAYILMVELQIMFISNFF